MSNDEIKNGNISEEHLTEFLSQFLQKMPNYNEKSMMNSFLSRQQVSDKTVADCIEAILGACLLSLGIERSFNILKLFKILPNNPNTDYSQLLQTQFASPRLRTNIANQEIDAFLINAHRLENRLGYKFKDRAYLLQALTHPSYPTNQVTGCYQQLEFLGDAVLDMLVSAYIYEKCPNMGPGRLTDLRSAIVNNITLACLCVRYDFHLFILSQNAVLSEKIAKFVAFQEQYNHEVTEQVMLLVAESDVRLGEFIDVPKALGDIFEALIGGVFLDSGNNLDVTWKVLYGLLKHELEKFVINIPLEVVRRLYEYPNANPKFDDPYVEDDIVMVNVRFTKKRHILQAKGFGENKENAKRAAAKAALHCLMEEK